MSREQEEALEGTFLEPYSIQTTEEQREYELYHLINELENQYEMVFDIPDELDLEK